MDTSDSGQAERIRQGDKAAFASLFHAHYEALCRFARSHVHSLEVAEDLVQNVFSDLWERRRTWRPARSPRVFLFGAVRNQVLKHERWSEVRANVQGGEALRNVSTRSNPEHKAQDREFVRAVEQVISELPPRRRSIFLLSRRHGLTYVEIAVALDISVKTVETQMGRALRFLRGRFSAQQLHSFSPH